MTLPTTVRPVRKERTGWRDEALSERHRKWGWDCPAVDVDFLMLEYDRGMPVALVEYKNEHAASVNLTHPTFRALTELADRAGVLFLLVRYATDFSTWRVTPVNQVAKDAILLKPGGTSVVWNEETYVRWLLHIRDEARKSAKPVDLAFRYYSFLAQKQCVRCGDFGVEVAHLSMIISPKSGGRMMRSHKGLARWGAVPLCPGCHRHAPDSIHSVGEAAFNESLGRGQHFLFQKAASLMAEFMDGGWL